jgi:Pvc16 N-terminal domain
VSTALAVAATSRVIAAVIDDAVAVARMTLPGILGAATTSSVPPDHLAIDKANEVTNLNLFLYHVTYNQGWREVGLPTRGPDGNSIGRSPLAIDLHYLLSAYSSGDYQAQIMLGIGMQALHEIPVLFRQKIQSVFAAPANDVDKALATADLADQIELVKIVPQQLGTEELSRLWTAFQSKFRVSAAYAVSVVLIETKAPVVAALPVLTRNLVVTPFLEPTIAAVDPQILPFAPVAALTISGSNLLGRGTVVVFDGNPQAPQTPTPLGDGAQVSTPLPALPAGINTLRLVRRIDLGVSPPTPFVESNTASFILQPVIRRDATPPHDYLITVGSPDNSVSPPRIPITVTLDPAITATQKISLLLNQLSPPVGQTPGSYMFDAAASDLAPPDQVQVYVQGVPHGNYLVRIRVDGADSPLDLDPATKAFAAPKVTL